MNSVAAASSDGLGLAAAISWSESSRRPPVAKRSSIAPIPNGSTGRRRKPSPATFFRLSRNSATIAL